MNSRCKTLARNLKQTLIALDQLTYCLIGTALSLFNPKIAIYADMTISAQAYRLEAKGKRYGKIMRVCIDALFRVIEKDHCYQSYLSEENNTQLPSDLR